MPKIAHKVTQKAILIILFMTRDIWNSGFEFLNRTLYFVDFFKNKIIRSQCA